MNAHMETAQAQTTDAQRIEEAALNAWPALHQHFYDGWVLRFAKGFTKRANSIVPLYPPRAPIDDAELARRVRYCENLYARERLQTVFRLTSIAPAPQLDAFLARRNYERIDPTAVLACDMSGQATSPVPPQLSLLGLDEWIEVYSDLAEVPRAARALHASLLRSIQGPAAFALVQQQGKPRACGLGVLEDGLLGLFDVVTAADARRQGHARTLLAGLLHWGREQGATRAYLQVLQSNEPALALYASAGFLPCYDYWYRVAP